MNENFIVIDATDDIVIGGFGNLEGNLGLLKYSYEEISQKMKENNNKEDNIRLVNSLLDSIRELHQENKKYKEVIDKAIEYIKSNPLVIIGDYRYFVNDLLQMEENFKEMSFIRTLLEILKEVE